MRSRSLGGGGGGSVPPYPLVVPLGTDPGLFSPDDRTYAYLSAFKPASQRVPDHAQHNMLTTGGLMIPVFSATPPPPGCYACRGLPLNAPAPRYSHGDGQAELSWVTTTVCCRI